MRKSAPQASEQEDNSDWPVAKLYRELAKGTAAAAKAHAVILTTGGMNPSHLGHVQLLHQARKRLEKEGYLVVGMWLSPSHDDYVQPKARNLKTIGLSADFRVEVARRSVKEDPLVDVGSWESRRVGYWPDFDEVTGALKKELDKLQKEKQIMLSPKVFYACGTDHAAKCGLYSGVASWADGVVVVPRVGEATQNEKPEKHVFVAEPCTGEAASFSSTKVREAIAQNNFEYVARSMSGKAADFLLHPDEETYHQYSSDFDLLGVKLRKTPSERQCPSCTWLCPGSRR